MIINIFLAFLLACPLTSCGEVKEYPWNDAWNETAQGGSEDDKQEPEQPETPVDPEEPGEPSQPTEPTDPETPEEPETPVDPETPVTPGGSDVPQGWTDVSSDFGELPSYIRILKSPSVLQGKNAVAYVAEADMGQAEWDVWSVKIKSGALTEQTEDSFKTPSDVYEAEECPVVINGGYFYYSGSKRYTASLAVSDSQVLAYNIGYEYDSAGKQCYPVRAVFRESENGSFDACWTYVKWDFSHWMYPSPSDNTMTQPSAAFPAGAQNFEAVTAIGGGPVLIDQGQFVNSYAAEMFYGIEPASDQPRTAVGVTSGGKMIFFVCEGRGMTAGVNGLTTADVANVLLELGCVEAINLDGGGSSCMLVNGNETIKVSDGSQRAVASALMLK